jgi:cytochrome c-type biogenesis protein CcmH
LGGLFSLFNRKKLSKKIVSSIVLIIITFILPLTISAEILEINRYDSSIEKRIHSINQNIRCMVCESQTIDDSNSPLAKDLRSIVREKVLRGDTNDQIYDFFRERYGDYIILKPPFRLNTIILWFTPIFLIIFGFFIIFLNQSINFKKGSNINDS